MKKYTVNSQQSTVNSNMWFVVLLLLTTHYSLLTTQGFSQVFINDIPGAQRNPSAMLDVSSTHLGMFINRMNTSQMNSITPTGSAESMLVFNVETNCFYAYIIGSGWKSVGPCPYSPCTPPSAPAATPSTPATNITCNSFTANWNASSPTAAYTYYLDVSTDATFSSTYVTGFQNLNVSNSTSFTITGLTGLTSYYYRVRGATTCPGPSRTYGPVLTTKCFTCGDAITVNYTPGSNGVPATSPSSITYHTTMSPPVDYRLPFLCWLTQNLGASEQANALNHTSHVASGWYFQFNRSQGYDLADDGTTRTPNSTWITTSYSGGNSWLPQNDPCAIQLGGGWRMPIYIEMYLGFASWDAHGPGENRSEQRYFNSVGHLEDGGYLDESTGLLTRRGNYTFNGIWSSNYPSNYWSWEVPTIDSWWGHGHPNRGLPLRCVHN